MATKRNFVTELIISIAVIVVLLVIVLTLTENHEIVEAQAANTFNCDPDQVQVVGDRGALRRYVYIHCGTPYDGTIEYFAFPMEEDHEMTSMIVTMGSIAIANDKNLSIQFDMSDTDASRYGCETSDCREIVRLWMEN